MIWWICVWIISNMATYLHVFKLDLRTTILTFGQSPRTLLWHVTRDLTTWYSLTTSACKNVRFSFDVDLARCARPASFWPTVDHLAWDLLATDVIEESWKRGRAHGCRGTGIQGFLRGAVASITAAQATWIEAHWVRHALSFASSCYSWFFSLGIRASTTS